MNAGKPSEAGDVVAGVDESGANVDLDPGTYLLSAAVCFVGEVEASRTAPQALLMKGQRKLHWIDESDKRRRRIIQTVSDLPLEHVMVIRPKPSVHDHPER